MFRLKEIREEKGILQKDLAAALNRTRACISSWEQGKTEPAIEDLIKLADFFEISIDVLLGHNQSCENSSSDAVDQLVFQIMKKLPDKDKIRALGYVQALAQQDYPY